MTGASIQSIVALSSTEGRVPRTWLFFLPGATVLFFTLIITLPWGFPPQYSYLPPLLILSVIFAWTVYHPRWVPPLLVFLTGIAMDVISASPIGFWAFLFLVGCAMARQVHNLRQPWLFLTVVLTYIPTAILIAALAWLIASAYFARMIDASPAITGAKFAILITPLTTAIIAVLHRWMTRPASDANMT